MTQQARTADVCTRFSLLIKALVGSRDYVSVISGVSATGVPTVRVWVAAQDRSRLLGRGSQVARSLRVLLDHIGEQQGVRYALEIDGVCFEHGCQQASLEKADADRERWSNASTLPAY